MTSKSKKSPKTPAKKIVPKKAVTKKKTGVRKSATATKKSVAIKNTATVKKAGTKKPIVKKKPAVKKSTFVKKSIATKKATPKKSINKTDIVDAVVKGKIDKPAYREAGPKIGILVEVVSNNKPFTEEKSIVMSTAIADLPIPDKNTRQRKFDRNYDKHQIELSTIKKGGPKPSGKKPLW